MVSRNSWFGETKAEDAHLSKLDHDQVEAASRLLEATMRSRDVTKAELRGALQRGLGHALSSGSPHCWGNEATDRTGNAAGRLLVRFANELGVPLSGVIAPTAVGLAEELLA